MVDAVRAALRLLPVARPGGACGRAARAHRPGDQSSSPSAVLGTALAAQPQAGNCERQALHLASGLARFARAFLAYVGVGVAAVAGCELAQPSVVHGREFGSGPEAYHSMAAADARAAWRRGSLSPQYMVEAQEDVVRAQKALSSPSGKTAADADAVKKGDEPGQSLSSNYWMPFGSHCSSESKLDMEWPLGACAGTEFQSEYISAGSDYFVYDENSKPPKQAPGQRCSADGNAGYVEEEFGATTNLELEWQLVVDPLPKCKPLPAAQGQELESADGEERDVEADAGGQEGEEEGFPENDWKDPTLFMQCGTASSSVDSLMVGEIVQVGTVSKAETLSSSAVTGDGGAPELRLRRQSWRTAGRDELAALVAQRAGEHVENCDLPTPLNTYRIKGSLETCQLGNKSNVQKDLSRSVDGKLLASLLQGQEPSRLENLGLPSSLSVLGTSAPVSVPSCSKTTSQPQAIPSLKVDSVAQGHDSTSSTDSRNTSWQGGGPNVVTVSGSGLLGQALCHSQTRAREAEKAARKAEEAEKVARKAEMAAGKAAEQASQEKEQLLHMFFREASLSLTYRHWATVLEAENFCLRIYARDNAQWVQKSIFNPFNAVERLSNSRCRNMGKTLAKRQMQHHFSGVWHDTTTKGSGSRSVGSHITRGCTVGLAFALGLSLAGAGLLLGWSMGWILLTY